MSVLVAFALLAAAWALMLGGLGLIGEIVNRTDQSAALPAALHIGAMWFLSPGVAGYVAIAGTPTIVPRLGKTAFYTAFMASFSTVAVVFCALAFILVGGGRIEMRMVLATVAQLACVLTGAWLARVVEFPDPPAAE